MKRTICHKDGTVSYWSVYQQRHIEQAAYIPDNELAAMALPERKRVVKHLENFLPDDLEAELKKKEV